MILREGHPMLKAVEYVPTVWLADEPRPARATGRWSDVWARVEADEATRRKSTASESAPA